MNLRIEKNPWKLILDGQTPIHKKLFIEELSEMQHLINLTMFKIAEIMHNSEPPKLEWLTTHPIAKVPNPEQYEWTVHTSDVPVEITIPEVYKTELYRECEYKLQLTPVGKRNAKLAAPTAIRCCDGTIIKT